MCRGRGCSTHTCCHAIWSQDFNLLVTTKPGMTRSGSLLSSQIRNLIWIGWMATNIIGMTTACQRNAFQVVPVGVAVLWCGGGHNCSRQACLAGYWKIFFFVSLMFLLHANTGSWHPHESQRPCGATATCTAEGGGSAPCVENNGSSNRTMPT